MAENTFRMPENGKKATKGKTRLGGFFSSMLDGTILTREKVEAMLPFFLFLALLAIALIFNTYYAEKKARELEQLRTEIIELRLRYITTKSELMILSNQTEVARRLKSRGVTESLVPPTQLAEPPARKRLLSRIIR